MTSGKGPTPISATVTAGAPTAARALLKQRSEDLSVGRSSVSTGLQTGSPTTPSEDASALGRGEGADGALPEDDHSDKGTYTIELENRNPEEEEARRMIDKVACLWGRGHGVRYGEGGSAFVAVIAPQCTMGCVQSYEYDSQQSKRDMRMMRTPSKIRRINMEAPPSLSPLATRPTSLKWIWLPSEL